MSKLALGTAQFGMAYGINNTRGKVPKEEVFQILDEALMAGIETIDTASVYGDSEQVLGEYHGIERFKIISKVSGLNWKEVEKILEQSFKNLKIENIYGCLIHNFNQYVENPEIFRVLESAKENGEIRKIGFSLYYPQELKYLIKNKVRFDIIQVPYSIFDRRFERYFPILKDMGSEIYIRSVFLQGLVFKNHHNLEENFLVIRNKLENLQLMSQQLSIPVAGLCLSFALSNEKVDYVVVGIDGLSHFHEILFVSDRIKNIPQHNFDNFKVDDENLLLPFRWNK